MYVSELFDLNIQQRFTGATAAFAAKRGYERRLNSPRTSPTTPSWTAKEERRPDIVTFAADTMHLSN